MKTEKIYHIYNRCNGKERMFTEERNYEYFLRKVKLYIPPVAEVMAYCLMPNHFHLMVRIKSEKEIREAFPKLKTLEKPDRVISKQFAKLFSCYTQSYNQLNSRKGSLFMKNFKRKEVDSDKYFFKLLYYIHANPVNHQYTRKIEEWGWSSYMVYIAKKKTFLNTKIVKDKFGSLSEFKAFHDDKYLTLDLNEERYFGKVFNFGKV